MIKIRIIVDQSSVYDDIEIIIRCSKVTDEVKNIMKRLKREVLTINGEKEGRQYVLDVKDCFYIETVDNKTFIYAAEEIYENSNKLYKLEDQLKETGFIRISKSCILNIDHIASVRALFNGKFEAMLTNSEKIIINRHYVKAFKEKFLGEGGK